MKHKKHLRKHKKKKKKTQKKKKKTRRIICSLNNEKTIQTFFIALKKWLFDNTRNTKQKAPPSPNMF